VRSYVFELDPRYTRNYTKIFSDCASDTIVFFILVLLYYKAMLDRLPIKVGHRHNLLCLVHFRIFFA